MFSLIDPWSLLDGGDLVGTAWAQVFPTVRAHPRRRGRSPLVRPGWGAATDAMLDLDVDTGTADRVVFLADGRPLRVITVNERVDGVDPDEPVDATDVSQTVPAPIPAQQASAAIGIRILAPAPTQPVSVIRGTDGSAIVHWSAVLPVTGRIVMILQTRRADRVGRIRHVFEAWAPDSRVQLARRLEPDSAGHQMGRPEDGDAVVTAAAPYATRPELAAYLSTFALVGDGGAATGDVVAAP